MKTLRNWSKLFLMLHCQPCVDANNSIISFWIESYTSFLQKKKSFVWTAFSSPAAAYSDANSRSVGGGLTLTSPEHLYGGKSGKWNPRYRAVLQTHYLDFKEDHYWLTFLHNFVNKRFLYQKETKCWKLIRQDVALPLPCFVPKASFLTCKICS